MQIPRFYEKSGQGLHVNSIYVVNSNSNCTAMFEFYCNGFTGVVTKTGNDHKPPANDHK